MCACMLYGIGFLLIAMLIPVVIVGNWFVVFKS